MTLRNLFHRVALQSIVRPSFESARLYSRWTHRRPSKVTLPYESNSEVNLKKENIISLDPKAFDKKEENLIENNTLKKSTVKLSPEKSKEIKQKRDETLKKRKFYLSQTKVLDDNNEVIYEKLKDNDGWLSSLLVKLKAKKERMRNDQVLVEGWRLIVDGLEAKCRLKYIIFSNAADLKNIRPFLPKTGIKVFKTSYKDISMWSNLETSPGIFGIFETPTPDTLKMCSKPLPMQFICDQVREPGNLGAILRVAVGAGCEKVLLTKGCVDVWDPKVIRSGAGAHFRLPIHNSLDWEDISKQLVKDTSIFIADSNAKFQLDSDNDKEELVNGMKIPVSPYYGVEYASLRHVTLIIGGETEGISEDSYRLAAAQNGLRLNIPLQKGIDSLNTGMAAAVIAFEIRKQFIQAWRQKKLDRQAVHIT